MNSRVTVAALKEHLIDIERISESKIAIATGDQRELDGIDLFDRTCPIEYVITIEALKEGWDCSFAYIFCSVSRIQSATDVEQLLGRVLRMPYAKQRQTADLNKAYAFLSEPSFGEAARALADKLVDMGFEEDEALDNIEPVQRTLDFQRDLFGPQEEPEPVFRYTTPATPEILSELREAEHDGLQVRETAGGQVEIALTGWINQDSEQTIFETLPELAEIRQQERSCVYQQYLFATEANIAVSFDTAFTFTDNMYWDQRRYRGRWKPRKHFLGPDRVPAFDGADDGEEMQCAQVIDSLTAVKYWIRNVARHPNSFWLPTATDKFYPDFVALLNDGRLLVVEYKGAHIAEKRTIGALWERESNGKGLFMVAEKMVNGKDMRQQLADI